jgi:DNA-directed RNA polymerase specialized sigma24 family protein
MYDLNVEDIEECKNMALYKCLLKKDKIDNFKTYLRNAEFYHMFNKRKLKRYYNKKINKYFEYINIHNDVVDDMPRLSIEELTECIDKCGLAKKQLKVIKLYLTHNGNIAEISKITKLNYNTVKANFRFAILKLREYIKENNL